MSGTPAGRGGKSRIVIDVEQIRQQSARRRGGGARMGRGRKILSITALVIIGLVTLALVVGYVWWRSYTKTPAYSLALLLDAAQRDDARTVEELLDADRVAQGLVPQVAGKLAGGTNVNPTAIQQQAAALAPMLGPRVREGLRDEVTRSVKTVAEKTGGNLPFFLLALGVRRYADVREEGDSASVNLNVEGRALELQMERREERWKVVNIKDDALAASLAARVAPNLNAPPPTATPTPSRPARRRP